MKLTKIIAMISVVALAISVQVLTLIYGWGLEVKSWAAIIGWGVVGHTVVRAIGDAVLQDK
jgi:hypothetical protein